MSSSSSSTAAFISPQRTVLSTLSVLTPQGVQPHHSVVVHQGRIEAIERQTPRHFLMREEPVHYIGLSDDYLLTPGLIDLQLNGAFGCDFNTAGISALHTCLGQLLGAGVTGVLPTLVSAPLMDMVNATNTFEEALRLQPPQTITHVLGLHLEGPVLNPAKRGAHPSNAMVEPLLHLEELELLLSPTVKMVTLAPECDAQHRWLNRLRERGMVVFAGHTQATNLQLQAAAEAGLAGVTHLFNAMQGFTHRQVGTALHVLNHPTLLASLIADGHHVAPEVVALTLKMMGPERLLLVSDAMALAGQAEGSTTHFAGQTVTLRQGQAVNEEGHLAGSAHLLPAMVRNMVAWGVCTLPQAFAMATSQPAKVLGLQHQLGSLVTGYTANMVLWRKKDLEPMATWLEGHLVWCHPDFVPTLQGQTQGQPMATANAPRDTLATHLV
jgi:N-acetylglucosamine-6-phosphate deacetylase